MVNLLKIYNRITISKYNIILPTSHILQIVFNYISLEHYLFNNLYLNGN